MNIPTIPTPLIPFAQQLESAPIRVDRASPEVHLLGQIGFAAKVRRFGPTPRQPPRSFKPAHELRPGDYLVHRDQTHHLDQIYHGDGKVWVDSSTLRSGTYYLRNDCVEVANGPIRIRTSWEQYALTEDAKISLALQRLKPVQTSCEDAPQATWLGSGRVRVGHEVYALEDQAANVLQALVELGAASTPELQKTSGVEEPVKILRKICREFPLLEPHIIFPGGRGRGGYRTTIVSQSQTTTA